MMLRFKESIKCFLQPLKIALVPFRVKRPSEKAIFLSILALIVLGIIFTPGYVRIRRLAKLLREQEEQIERVEQDNERLAQELESLKNDPLYLEKVARQKLGVVRKGEVVYKVLPEQENE